jgi:hypothetical protein
MTEHNLCDRGSILPLVLVVSVVLSAVVVAVATYTTAELRYSKVSEDRAGRVASAQGAMDDALEQLSLRSSLCATAAGASGIDVPFPETVNGNDVVVTCRIVGGALPPADGWAIVVTGEGAPDDSSPTFEFTLGGKPEINGPVFLSDPARSTFSQPTTIVEGDVWYPDAACAETASGDGGVQYTRSSLALANLGFDPSSRGLYCVNRSWDGLFGATLSISPDVATYAGGSNAAYFNRPPVLNGSCRVFEPGYYTSLPLGNNNYFKSGDYVFADLGLVSLQGKKVTMGQIDREQYPAIDNSACDNARVTDPDKGGATLYTRGSTRIESRANSGFEVSGRRQGAAVVALHVLDSSIGYSTPLLAANNGAQKEVSLQGLLWAPYNSLVFDTVPAQKAAVLRGGAVVASFRGGVSAAAVGFVIEVPTSKSSTRLLLESVATDNRASNTVRVVADYRPSTGEVAVQSRRVLG